VKTQGILSVVFSDLEYLCANLTVDFDAFGYVVCIFDGCKKNS
jgi:hypothetical protein